MAANSPKELIKVVQWVDPDAHGATANIASLDSEIDTIGFRYAVVIVNVGTTDTTAWTINVEASATSGGSFTNITGASFPVVTGSGDTAFVGIIDLQGSATGLGRYLQLNGTASGGTGTDLGVTLLLVGPKDTQPNDYVDWGSGGADEPTFEV